MPERELGDPLNTGSKFDDCIYILQMVSIEPKHDIWLANCYKSILTSSFLTFHFGMHFYPNIKRYFKTVNLVIIRV